MFTSILCPVDLGADESWTRALAAASDLAAKYNASLHVLTVVPDFGMSIVGSYFEKGFEKKALQEATKKLAAFVAEHVPAGVDAHPHVAHGAIYDEIMQAANALQCDAIVMAASRPELKDYLLGPNAARVVRHARQSVFVIRD
ncbi:MAG: universal stress protein [Pseudomonadota bacterium]